MKHWTLTFLLLFSTAAVAQTPPACSSTQEEQLATLRNAPGLVSAIATYETEGEVPRLLTAFRCVFASADAVEALIRLRNEGNIAGQLFALVGLKELAPQEFKLLVQSYLKRPGKVALIGGDVAAQADIAITSAQIAEGLYSVLTPLPQEKPVLEVAPAQ